MKSVLFHFAALCLFSQRKVENEKILTYEKILTFKRILIHRFKNA